MRNYPFTLKQKVTVQPWVGLVYINQALTRPVATGAMPITNFLYPSNFFVLRKICFNNIIKTKILPPYIWLLFPKS